MQLSLWKVIATGLKVRHIAGLSGYIYIAQSKCVAANVT